LQSGRLPGFPSSSSKPVKLYPVLTTDRLPMMLACALAHRCVCCSSVAVTLYYQLREFEAGPPAIAGLGLGPAAAGSRSSSSTCWVRCVALSVSALLQQLGF
jgi:hypothetical protein